MFENAPEVVAALDEGFRRHTLQEVHEKLGPCGKIAVERARHSCEIPFDPQVLENGIMVDWTDGQGNLVKMPTNPVRIGDNVAAEFRNGPNLGEHTCEIMKRLNYSAEEIEDFIRRDLVVAVPQI